MIHIVFRTVYCTSFPLDLPNSVHHPAAVSMVLYVWDDNSHALFCTSLVVLLIWIRHPNPTFPSFFFFFFFSSFSFFFFFLITAYPILYILIYYILSQKFLLPFLSIPNVRFDCDNLGLGRTLPPYLSLEGPQTPLSCFPLFWNCFFFFFWWITRQKCFSLDGPWLRPAILNHIS